MSPYILNVFNLIRIKCRPVCIHTLYLYYCIQSSYNELRRRKQVLTNWVFILIILYKKGFNLKAIEIITT